MAKHLLTASTVKYATPHENGKPKKYNDGGGLYLIVFKSGLKSWRYNYTFAGKQQTVTFGNYPELTLSLARDAHTEALNNKRMGINPAEKKQRDKYKTGMVSFKMAAEQWYETNVDQWAERTASKKAQQLRDYVYPFVGSVPVNEVKPPEILNLLRKIENTGKRETAHRVKQTIGQILRYAVSNHWVERDFTLDLKEALKTPITQHRAAIIEPNEVGALLRDIDNYMTNHNGNHTTYYALKILPYVFVRMGEFRMMEWTELDFENRQWLIPADKMKMKTEHIVPLADQVITLLNELSEYNRHSKYVFRGANNKNRPMSENTVNDALRKMGYGKDRMCSHGFRSTAASSLYDMNYSEDEVETQLAHVERNKVKGAYDRRAIKKKLPERIRMMQAYADFLDSLRNGADVIPLKQKRG